MELNVDIEKKLSGFMLNAKFKTNLESIGVIGASGSGKSLMLRCIAGIEKPDKGKITLDDKVLFDSKNKINIPCRKRKIGYLFQNYALFPNMTVEENITLAIDNLDKVQIKKVLNQKIEMLKLEGLEKRYPYQLSGGQQQRVALARALIVKPDILLLDEPFSSLDNYLRNHLIKQMIDVLKEFNGVCILVTHNMDEAFKLSERLIVLSAGRIEANGLKEEVFLNPPTISSAKITGCKNISKARHISYNQIEAIDWNIKIKTNNKNCYNAKNVGIRAHYIRLANEKDVENVFNVWPVNILEGPFEMTVYLALNEDSRYNHKKNLQWQISKEMWCEINDLAYPWKICIPPENLIIFEV